MGLQSLASALGGSGINELRSEVLLTGLHPITEEPEETFVFQYFPESITDSKAINHQSREVVGGTLPVYQWISSGERTIGFTAQFASDVDLLAQGTQKAGEIYDRLRTAGVARRSVVIRTALAYLRSFLFPRYAEQGPVSTQAPRKIRLTIPKSGIGLNGGAGVNTVSPDTVYCLMNQCEITYEAFFPSGNPRLVSVQLSFAQIAQYGGQVNFPQTAVDWLPGISDSGGGHSVFGGSSLGSAIGAVNNLLGSDSSTATALGSM